LRRTESVAIEGIADIRRSLAGRRSDAIDPTTKWTAQDFAAQKDYSFYGVISSLYCKRTAADDPVRAGLVSSLNSPGGNLTGISAFAAPPGAKRLGLLHELLPAVTTVAFLVNPKNRDTVEEAKEVEEAARGRPRRRGDRIAMPDRLLSGNPDIAADMAAGPLLTPNRS
jgi:ABC-type uncharacterized transport system substrate-binding protein